MAKMFEIAFQLAGKVNSSFNSAFQNADRRLDQLEERAEGMSTKLAGMGKVAGGIGLAVGGAAAAVGGLALNLSDNLQNSLNGVQSATGVADGAMSGMKDTMLAIYNNNLGENFEDIGAALTTVSQQTGLTGDALQKVAEDGLVLRDTFGMGVNESVRAANQLMKQFGMDGDTAYNLIAQGARSGMDANGDLLDTLNEYGGTFAAQGFNAEEMFNMLSNASKSGIRNVDLAADAIKEFGIRSMDGSSTSAAGFEALGLNASSMTKSFATGGDVANEAFDKTTKALLAMENPVAQNAAGVALFGTQFEDLGIKGFAALVNTKGSIDDTKDALKEINDVKYNTFGEAMTRIKRNLETGLLIPLGDKITPTLNQFAGWITDNMPAIQNEISYAMDVAGRVLNSISEVINTNVMPIFNTFSGYITENMPQIKGAIQAMYDYVEPSFSRLGEVIQSDLMPMVQGLWGLIEKAMPTIKVIFEVALGVVATVLKHAVENIATFIEIAKGIYDFIKPPLELVIDIFNGVAGAIQWAIDKLDIFNRTPAKDKKVTTNYKNVSGAASLAERHGDNMNSDGSYNFIGMSQAIPHAWGGIMNSPHLGLVAEEGPEAIVPLGNRARGLQVWSQAGKALGVGGGGGDTINVTFAPVIHGAGPEIMPALKDQQKDFMSQLKAVLHDQRRVSYG